MNKAIHFSENESLVAKKASSDQLLKEDFTLQCWVKTTSSGPLFTQYSTKEEIATFLLEINPNGTIYFEVREQELLHIVQTKQAIINDGQWHQLTAIKKGAQITLILDQKEQAVQTHWTPFNPTSEKAFGFMIGSDNLFNNPNFFIGEMGDVKTWNTALTKAQTINYIEIEPRINKATLRSHFPINKVTPNQSFQWLGDGCYIPVPVSAVKAKISIKNDTNETLKLTSETESFPKEILAKTEITVTFNSSVDAWPTIQEEVCYENINGTVTIAVTKTLNKYQSGVTVTTTKDLVNDVNTIVNDQKQLNAEITIGESLIIVNMRNVYNFLNALRGNIKRDQIETPDGNLFDRISYNAASQVFNRRFQLRPFAIIFCESKEDVQFVYNNAIANNLPIRVRSGGHDHEAECSGTNTILIDLSRMNNITLEKKNNDIYAYIEPGNKFQRLTSELANKKVMIPHGTCATVGIAGFTMGGGWGPWTRLKGMCCEHLVAATVVLGNGEIIEATEEQNSEILWALRGGGGMSYGIVTEFVIKTFPLPEELIKFELEWNPYISGNATKFHENTPTINVLQAWENSIISKETPQLIGTNLKVSGRSWNENMEFNETTITHNCLMYGYWQGDKKELEQFIATHFANTMPEEQRIDGFGGTDVPYGEYLMSSWDRESHYNVKRLLKGEEGKPIPPDLDAPAPHKITSRLVNQDGLQEGGYKAFLRSLTSPLILEGNRELGLFTYTTLGAIVGDFYHNISEADKKRSAFPYKDKLYTIQYQTWWNEALSEKELGQNNKVYNRTNRALDWMQECRDYNIPNTSGAFISFKDSSIPTETYFAQNYDELKRIKETYVEDPLNHFRTRKTII